MHTQTDTDGQDTHRLTQILGHKTYTVFSGLNSKKKGFLKGSLAVPIGKPFLVPLWKGFYIEPKWFYSEPKWLNIEPERFFKGLSYGDSRRTLLGYR